MTTTISVDASPLRAAREWRGLSLVAAARSSGLHLAQAEALEEGDAGTFVTVEEMVAAAVLYGATLGIGRDEAMALLDRTIAAGDAIASESSQLESPVENSATTGVAGTAAFSAAVRGRSATHRIAGDEFAEDLGLEELTGATVKPGGEPGFDSTVLDDFDNRPVPARGAGLHADDPDEREQTGEIPLPTGDASARARERSGDDWRETLRASESELEQWVGSHDSDSAARTRARPQIATMLASRVRTGSERVLGPERTRQLSARFEGGAAETRRLVRELRQRLEQSEHATLIVAVAVGLVLVAALMGIASMSGGENSSETASKPKVAQPAPPAAGLEQPATPAGKDAQQAKAKPAAVLPPAKVHVNVLNAGSRTGYAKVVAARLEARKYQVEDVGNTNSRYGTSVILHPPSLKREAERLARQTGIATTDTIAETGGPRTLTVIVV